MTHRVYSPVQLREDLVKLPTWDARLEHFAAITPNTPGYSKEHKKNACVSFMNRAVAVNNYQAAAEKIQTPVTLVRPSVITFKHDSEDYGLPGMVGTAP